MARRKDYKYTGVLAEPIYSKLLASKAMSPDDPELQEKVSAEFREQYQARLEALAAESGTVLEKPETWWRMALMLAERHVPGFDFRKPARGTPKRWDYRDDLPMVIAMERKIAGGLTIRNAARLVSKERGIGETAAAIDRKYRRFLEPDRMQLAAAQQRWEPKNAFAGMTRQKRHKSLNELPPRKLRH